MSENQGPAQRLDHVAVAVANLEESLRFYKECLGLECFCIEEVAEQGVRVAKLNAGNTHIELLEPLAPDTPVGKFIAKRGQGLHHLCFQVDGIGPALIKLADDGVRLIDPVPKIGAEGAQIAFVHPASTGGVLMELSQPCPSHPAGERHGNDC